MGWIDTLRNGFQLLRNGHRAIFWRELRTRLYSSSTALCLRLDLEAERDHPKPRIPIVIRPLRKDDNICLLEESDYAKAHPRWKARQLRLVESDLPTCYIAAKEHDQPCFMQWLLLPIHDTLIRDHLGKAFEPLLPDQALLEGGYMHPDCRKNGIMPAALSRIAVQAKAHGCTQVITYVDLDNIPSLIGCRRAGFQPYKVRRDRWYFLSRSLSFDRCPPHLTQQFYDVTDAHLKP
jgi:RimJ/RimL family protein N-acetyltransferase